MLESAFEQWDMSRPNPVMTAACLLVWILCCGHALAAISPAPAKKSAFTIDRWESEEGLPENAVIAITQTPDGYLWLGTLNGLARFDGTRFTTFDENNTPELGSSRIVYLFTDGQGRIWVGTETAGAALVKDGQVMSLNIGAGNPGAKLVGACEDERGAVWLYTADGQLWRKSDGAGAILFPTAAPNPYGAIIAEPSGPIWLAIGRQLYHVDPKTLKFVPDQNSPSNRLDFLLASQHGGYWRLADGRVQRWRNDQLERDLAPYSWGNATVSAACEDREGNLLVGTLGAGVFWFDAQGNSTCISTNEGLSYNFILSLYADREGSVWVGTDGGGLNRIKRQVFDVLPPSRGLVVQSVCPDNHGGLWIGSTRGGVLHWTGDAFKVHELGQGITADTVFVDAQQRVWAGTRGKGLFQLVQDEFQPVPGTEFWQLFAIHQDRKTNLWFGTQVGLSRWEKGQWTRRGVSSSPIRAIADDAAGNFWVGTEGGGLIRMRGSEVTNYRKKDGLPSDKISSLHVDAEGTLWIGTPSSGLGRFHQGKWTRYSTREGLISNSIGYIMEDDQGYLWIGSVAGLMRVQKKALQDFAEGLTTFIPFRAYGKADGLPTGECSIGSQPAAAHTPDGKLWFPTIKGLASVDPAELKPNLYPPPVIIETVLIDGAAGNTDALRSAGPQKITLPADKERLDIFYTSLNLSAPSKARFKYRLFGHETAWTEAGNIRSAHYSKLPPGNYRFEVTACNEDGVWNPTGSSLALTVQPPFWRTWWFITASLACLLGTIIGVVHYLSTQRLQGQVAVLRQQEALQVERSRIARDLHDQLGARLTQVSLLGDLVESDKHSPNEVEAHAQQISQTARDTTRVLDEIVWTVNPSNDTLDGLFTYVCTYAQDYLALAGLRYRLDAPAQLPAAHISPEVRHNVFLAVKEAITNVVRHAHATAAFIRLRLEPTRFTLEIEDNGRGIGNLEETMARSRNGLRNMRQRMDDIKGEFSLGPGSDGGTVIRLTAPLQKAEGRRQKAECRHPS